MKLTDQQPHTPTTEQIELIVLAQLKQSAERHGLPHDIDADRADFRRWLSGVEATAEQRGAERAFDEAVEKIASMEGNRMILARYKHLNPYRADRIANKEVGDA